MSPNPFGETPDLPRKANPFGDEPETMDAAAAADRVDQAAKKIRTLRTQVSSEGLTLPATKLLVDEVSAALEAVARALRERS